MGQDLETPQRIAKQYRYIELLGEGANGNTYLADALGKGKRVAIKALKLHQSALFKSFELFKREAETLSSIHVRGVPRFYESILSDDVGSECYIIQEYVDAPSIQSYLDGGRVFSERETLWVMRKVVDILRNLHTQYSPPIIHRDIKPSNILCRLPEDTKEWENINPYLIDFGAVANAQSNSDKSTVAGTVGYMAPEQNFNECFPQTDLYALGATALHMLTGIAPYEMDFHTYALDYRKVLKEHAPKTSRHMRELLGRLLDYSYDKRPASALVVGMMIDRVLAGKKPAPRKSVTLGLGRFGAWLLWTFSRLYRSDIDFSSDIDDALLEPLGDDATRCKTEIGLDLKKYGLVTGTIYKQVILPIKDSLRDNDKYLEYTFTVEDETWCGGDCNPPWWLAEKVDDYVHGEYHSLSILQKLRRDKPKPWWEVRDDDYDERLDFPLKCVVIYLRKDPSYNRIYYILQKNQNSGK